jgi:thiopurine S-methyltransferase
LQPEFWHDRWRKGQIGFHQSAVDARLQRYWPGLGVASGSRVFVPLCGKSLDMLWLLEHGYSVVGIDLSAVALESFCMENGIGAKRRMLGDLEVYETANLQLYCGDFFALTTKLLGSVAAVYDRAALIAWTPDQRAAYVTHMTSLTRLDTQTLLITLEYPQAQMSGPPFSVSADDVERFYARSHTIRELGRYDILANEARLRSRGVTQLHEACYLLTRL